MKISLSQLFVLLLVIGMALALSVSWFRLSKAQHSIDVLSNQLRDQIENNAFSVHTEVIAHSESFVVYMIVVESTFQHALRFTTLEEGRGNRVSESYVDPKTNTWMSRIVLSGIKTGDSTECFLSGVSGIPMGDATPIGKPTTGLPELQGFGVSGNEEFDRPLQLTLESEGGIALPFKTELLRIERPIETQEVIGSSPARR